MRCRCDRWASRVPGSIHGTGLPLLLLLQLLLLLLLLLLMLLLLLLDCVLALCAGVLALESSAERCLAYKGVK